MAARLGTRRQGGAMHRRDTASLNVLIVDLNNFASFPTLAVGLIVAGLRNRGMRVDLLSPLAYDVPASVREHAENITHHWRRRIHLSTNPLFRTARDAARDLRGWWLGRPHPVVLREVRKALAGRPDAILLSAYLHHEATARAIGAMARAAGVPLLIGGPAFTVEAAVDLWRTIPGLAAIVAAETDLAIADIVETLVAGGDLLRFDGVTLPDGRASPPAKPLMLLDAAPVPDFADFPWDRYPARIIPLMASRGCQWSRCTFCSDIVSVSGRSFRNRSAESVLHEMREQARRHATRDFLFLDLKLNSNPHLLRAIVEGVQDQVPGAQWLGTVHVDERKDNGLSRRELRAAVAAGMRRISFGLESGSQRLLDLMDKGCSVEANSAFIRHAHEAGLSIRATMFKGYPGETAADLAQTADFLERHARWLDRVRFNDFSVPLGTPIHRQLAAAAPAAPIRRRSARMVWEEAGAADRAYRREKRRVLAAVHAINRRPLRSSARAFDGLM